MHRFHRIAVIATCGSFLLGGCAAGSAARSPQEAHAGPADASDAGLEPLIRQWRTDQRYVSRFYSTPWSEERLDRLDRFDREWTDRLAGVGFDGLSRDARVDYILLRNAVRSSIADRELERRQLAEMDRLLPFRRPIQELEAARRRMEALDPERAAAALAAVPAQVKAAREMVEAARKAAKDAKSAEEAGTAQTAPADTISPTVARRTAGAVSDLKRTLDGWAEYYDGFKPEFGWWVRRPREDAGKALDDYARFLREEIAGIKGEPEDPLIGDPIGEEALQRALQLEVIPYTARDLIRIGETELAWCEEEMKKAAAEMGLGDDWKGALERVKADHSPPGDQDNLVREEARAAIEFIRSRDLVSIPAECEEMWRMEMLSPEAQKTLPFAVYGGQYMGVAYPTDRMPHEDKLMSMRGNNRHFTHIVTPHELIPGHHLQGYVASRSRAYREAFSTPFLVEGWALYWETRLWDLGYARGPEDRIGMLFWRMHRCARIIVSLKFHLGEMTPEQMVDFLVDRVGHERFGATSEVRRFIGGDYSPLYQCGYMIGGLQLRALHAELVGTGAMTDRRFNDAVLRENSIPIELIRSALTGAPLTADGEAGWRFRPDLP